LARLLARLQGPTRAPTCSRFSKLHEAVRSDRLAIYSTQWAWEANHDATDATRWAG
jgi:hypothetical protein